MKLSVKVSTLIFLAIIAACFNSALGKLDVSKLNATDLADKAFTALDRVEAGAKTVVEWTRAHRQLVKGSIGMILVLYGGHFANTMLFVHSLGVAGMPVIINSFKELAASYKATRDVLKKELPEILKAKEELSSLTSKMSKLTEDIKDAKKDFDSGVISKDQFDSKAKAAQAAINDLKGSLEKINAVGNFFSSMKAAINPAHLQEIAVAVYQTAMMGIAAVTNQAIATMTMGLNMGKVICDRGFVLFHAFASTHHSPGLDAASDFVNTHPEWIKTASNIVSRTVGVMIAFVMKKAAHVFSACTVGSTMVIGGLEELLDPVLTTLSLPTLKETPGAATVAQTALIAFGYYNQLIPGKGSIPTVLKLVLAPILAFEFFLSKFAMKQALF